MMPPELSPSAQSHTRSQIDQALAYVESSVDERATIAQQILAWTNGQPELTRCVVTRVIERISQGSDLDSVELVNNQVRAYFSPGLLTSTPSQDTSVTELLTGIKKALLQDRQQSYRLLEYYQAVLLSSHRLPLGYQIEQKTLLDLGLLRQDDQTHIKIANPIYRRVFSADWVEQQLSQPFRMRKGHWLLLTSLLSILAFVVLQSVFRYIPTSATYRCNQANDLKEATLAKLSLDPEQMRQSIDQLLNLQKQDQLSKQCQSVLYDLQYNYGIHVAAGTYNNPLNAATTYLCQIPESYYVERNAVPWFSRWSNLYHSAEFAESLADYVERNPCPSYIFLNRINP